jgi:hypothetical protein
MDTVFGIQYEGGGVCCDAIRCVLVVKRLKGLATCALVGSGTKWEEDDK